MNENLSLRFINFLLNRTKCAKIVSFLICSHPNISEVLKFHHIIRYNKTRGISKGSGRLIIRLINFYQYVNL
jgi:hypothetical protein